MNFGHEAAAFKNSGGTSLELLLFLSDKSVFLISSCVGARESISIEEVIF